MKKLLLSAIPLALLLSGCAVPMGPNQHSFQSTQYIVPQTGYYE